MAIKIFRKRGVSLIELIVAIAILSFIAVAGVPTYQKQMTRSRIASLMPLAEGQQVKVATAHSRGTKFGTSTETIIASGDSSKPKFLDSLVRGNYGCIYLNIDLAQVDLSAVGPKYLAAVYCPSQPSDSTHVTWACGYSANSEPTYVKYLPLDCQQPIVEDTDF